MPKKTKKICLNETCYPPHPPSSLFYQPTHTQLRADYHAKAQGSRYISFEEGLVLITTTYVLLLEYQELIQLCITLFFCFIPFFLSFSSFILAAFFVSEFSFCLFGWFCSRRMVCCGRHGLQIGYACTSRKWVNRANEKVVQMRQLNFKQHKREWIL